MRWAAILILLAACSTAPEPPPAATPPPVPIPTATPEPRRYASLEAIYADLECESTDRIGVGNNGHSLRDFGHCYHPWASLDVYLTRYGMVGSWSHITSHEPGVIGPNWVILAGTIEAARATQGMVGGELAP